jgi:tetratricopeptide (TPR) repeat protein
MLLSAIEEAGEEGWQHAAGAHQILGWITYDEADYDQAERHWQRSLEMMESHGNKPGKALVLSNLGCLYATLNYVQKGIEHAERGRDLAAQIGYKVGEQEGWLRIGEFWLGVGQYEKTEEGFARTMEIADQLASAVWARSYVRNRMVRALLDSGGDLDRADRLSQESLEIAGEDGGGELLGWLWHVRGQVLVQLGQSEQAQELFERAAQARLEIGQVDMYLPTMADLGRLHLQNEDLDAAQKCAEKMLELLFPAEGKGRENVAASMACYHILQASGKGERARELLAHAHEILQRDAARLENDELRRSYLERIPLHGEVSRTYLEAFTETK